MNRDTVQLISNVVQAFTTLVFGAATLWYAHQMHHVARTQIEPQLDAVATYPTRLVLANSGIDPIVDITVDIDDVTLFNSKPVVRGRAGKHVPGKTIPRFWYLDRLRPEDGVQETSLEDKMENALRGTEMMERIKPKGGITTVAPDEKGMFWTVMIARVTYHREADRKRYTKVLRFVALRDQNGKPELVDGLFLEQTGMAPIIEALPVRPE